MARKEHPVVLTRGKALGLALLLSVILFAAGLYSGLSANKLIKAQQEEDMSFLIGYVSTLEEELRSIQIQESFLDSLDEEQRCQFAEEHFSEVAEQLNYYWSIFPTRLESYERDRELTPEYLQLKAEYTKLSLRAWIVARENYRKCKTETIPVLYFYSLDCEECPMQGRILDTMKERVEAYNQTLLAFTVDLEQEEPSLPIILDYYGINETPALVINEAVLQGRLFSEEEIATALAGGSQ